MMEWKFQYRGGPRFLTWIARVFVVFAAVSYVLAAAESTSVKETRRVIAGERYRVSGFHELLLGKDYRDLWTTPIEVEGEAVAESYFRRRFSHKETTEIRIYLYGGDDIAIHLGGARHGIKVRVVGGAGSYVVDDSEGGGIHFFDSKGDNHIVAGPGTKYDPHLYNQPDFQKRARSCGICQECFDNDSPPLGSN